MTEWMASSDGVLLMRSLNASSGAAAYGTLSALSTWKLRSGMRLLLRARAFLQAEEELRNLRPDLGSSGKAAPVQANQADQLVTLVDGDAVELAGRIDAVDQQGLNVRLQVLEDRILLFQLPPGFQRQQRFRDPGRTGIKRLDLIGRRAT